MAVFLSLIHGRGYSELLDLYSWVNVPFPSETTFYEHQKTLSKVILRMAEESCDKYCNSEHKGVGFDGSWSQKRNAPHCIVDAISIETHKIIDFQIVTQYKFPYASEHVTYDPTISSKAMEGLGLEQIAQRQKINDKTDYYCHDGDLTAEVILLNSGLQLKQVFDPNHFIPTILNKYATSVQMDLLSGISDRLIKRFKRIFHDKEIPDDQKKQKWIDSYTHYINDDKWEKHSTPEAQHALEKFLYDSSICFDFMKSGVSTNINESFHALKAEFAPKNINWRYSFVLRMCVAIIAFNEGPNWKTILAEKLKIKLPTNPVCRRGIEAAKARYDKFAHIHAAPDFAKKRAIQRKQKRERNLQTKDQPLHKDKNEIEPEFKTKTSFKKNDVWPGITQVSQGWKSRTFYAKGEHTALNDYLNKISPQASRVGKIDEKESGSIFTFKTRDKSLLATCTPHDGITVQYLNDSNIAEALQYCAPDLSSTKVITEPENFKDAPIELLIDAMKKSGSQNKVKKSKSQEHVQSSSSSSDEEEEDEEDEDDDIDDVSPVCDNNCDCGGLLNVTHNCYANVIVQLFARINTLYEIVKKICDVHPDDSLLTNLLNVTTNLRNGKNENIIDICQELGFEPMKFYDSDLFMSTLLQYITSKYSDRYVNDIQIDKQQYNIVLLDKKEMEKQVVNILKTCRCPKILFVSCTRKNAVDKACFRYADTIQVKQEMKYKLIAVILRWSRHFKVIIKSDDIFRLYDDACIPSVMTENEVFSSTLYKICYCAVYERIDDHSMNLYV